MSNRSPLRVLPWIVLVSYAVVLAWSAHAVFIGGDAAVYDENGPLESLQATLLAMACAMFLAGALRTPRDGRLILLSCAWLCFAFVVNELDVERLDVPELVKHLGAGRGRNVLLAISFGVLVVCAVARFSYHRQAVGAFLRSRPGVLLMLAGVMLVAGRLFEKNIPVVHNAYWEEILELAGHCLMLLTAQAALPGATAAHGEAARPMRSAEADPGDR